MRMSEVKVGMRLRLRGHPGYPMVTVTELTERGFRYRLDFPMPLVPRLGLIVEQGGHEHFGTPDGDCLFDLVTDPAPTSAAAPRDRTPQGLAARVVDARRIYEPQRNIGYATLLDLVDDLYEAWLFQ